MCALCGGLMKLSPPRLFAPDKFNGNFTSEFKADWFICLIDWEIKATDVVNLDFIENAKHRRRHLDAHSERLCRSKIDTQTMKKKFQSNSLLISFFISSFFSFDYSEDIQIINPEGYDHLIGKRMRFVFSQLCFQYPLLSACSSSGWVPPNYSNLFVEI